MSNTFLFPKTPQNSGFSELSIVSPKLHCLSMVFAGELGDPVFQDLEVIDVAATDDGQFLVVSLVRLDTSYEMDDVQVVEKCQAVQGYLRAAIASSVNRKRVPVLKFELL